MKLLCANDAPPHPPAPPPDSPEPELLPPEIIVERFVSQSPKELLIAPDWGLKNYEFTAKLEKRMKERDTWQGKLFNRG